MNQEEHLSMARELMRRADQESAADGGNEMIAAEFLWGTFAHCLITVAQNEGLPHDSHGAFTCSQGMTRRSVGDPKGGAIRRKSCPARSPTVVKKVDFSHRTSVSLL